VALFWVGREQDVLAALRPLAEAQQAREEKLRAAGVTIPLRK